MRTIYILGGPASGKTTLMAQLVRGGEPTQFLEPVPYLLYASTTWLGLGGQVVQLGKDRGSFSGTDALSMSVQPAAVKFVEEVRTDWLLVEGDRLANDGFFEACRARGTLYVFRLIIPMVMARERAAARGSQQDEKWFIGRYTKVSNLADKWPNVPINGAAPTLAQAQIIKEIVHAS